MPGGGPTAVDGGDAPACGHDPRRAIAALVTTALVALVVLWPMLAHPDRDGFPLSTYPMFSRPRPAPAAFATVVGIDRSGRAHWLSPTLANGTREVVQAATVVARQVAEGRADQLCAAVARRLAASPAPVPAPEPGTVEDGATPVVVEVVTVRADAVAWFADPDDRRIDGSGSDVPDRRSAPPDPASASGLPARTVHARCPVTP